VLTVTLDTGTLRLVDALGALGDLEVDIAVTTVTGREVEGTAWAGKVKQLKLIRETAVWGESRWDEALLAGAADATRYERLLALLSGGGFPKPGQRDNLTEGLKHLQRDVMILAAHAREARDIFVSNDTRAIGRAGELLRERLHQEFGIRAMTLDEFTACYASLRSTEPTA
jgi:hypothetical protein